MKQFASVVEYITFDIDQIPQEIKKSEDLKKYVLLNTQGGCVEFIETNKTALAMYIFVIMHRSSPEVILHTRDDSKYVIYNHNVKPIIHPVGVDDTFSISSDHNVLTPSEDDAIIEIEKFWMASKELSKSSFDGYVKNIKGLIKRTRKTTIIGSAPLFIVLATLHLVGNNSEQIYYKRDNLSEAKRIK